MKSMKIKRFKEEFKRYPKKHDILTKDEEKRFNSKCSSFGCGGCFYSELVKFVLGDMSSKLNRRFYFSRQKGLYSDFIDGYNLNNDEEFMKCIADMTTLYFNKCLLGYNTLDEVVECKENINVDPRNKYEKISEKIEEGKLLLQSYCLHNHNENVDYDFWEEYLGEK